MLLNKTAQIAKESFKRLYFLPRVFIHFLKVVNMSHVNVQMENLCIPRSLVCLCGLFSLLLLGEHFQEPQRFSPGCSSSLV